jgi:Protein of unknown function (DUF2852)
MSTSGPSPAPEAGKIPARRPFADQRAQPLEIIGHDASLCRDRFPAYGSTHQAEEAVQTSGPALPFSEASEYLVAHTSTTKNPYPYHGRATQYRFASFKRSTWSGERSNQMSADTGMSYQSSSTRQNDGSNGRGYWHGEPWKPVEILAMVLGFIVFWPIGLAVLGWKFWQKKSGYPGDIISFLSWI